MELEHRVSFFLTWREVPALHLEPVDPGQRKYVGDRCAI